MKNGMFSTVIAIAFVIASWGTNAQVTARVLNDTTFVKAVEMTFPPGAKTDLHTHPAHFLYALTDGKLIVHFQDGKTQTFDLKQGMSGVSGPEKWHWTENPGTAPVRILLVELKDRPYLDPKK